MNPKEYRITIYSLSRFFITYIIVFCISINLLDYAPLEHDSIFVIVVKTSVVFFFSGYLASLLGTAKVRIVFTEEAFRHIWKKKFFFSSEQDIEIPWRIIDNYVYHEDRFFDSFIINLDTDQKYKVTRLSFFSPKDDFNKLIVDFPDLANTNHNQNLVENNEKTIQEGRSFYATKGFKWLFYIQIILFIVLVFSPDSTINFGQILVISSALVFYGAMIMKHKKIGK